MTRAPRTRPEPTFPLFSATLLTAALTLTAPASDARAQPATATVPASATATAPGPASTIWLSLPSIDGATGAELGYERWSPWHRVSLVGTFGFRHTASGDYSGYAGGAGVEARWYWRGRALWTPLPRGAMVGAFVGGRVDASISHTRDVADDRSLGSSLAIGGEGVFGYRIAPWRGLEITPSIGIGLRNEHDLRGRLPPWTLATLAVGLEVGWMF